jgi:death-on-curing protein
MAYRSQDFTSHNICFTKYRDERSGDRAAFIDSSPRLAIIEVLMAMRPTRPPRKRGPILYRQQHAPLHIIAKIRLLGTINNMANHFRKLSARLLGLPIRAKINDLTVSDAVQQVLRKYQKRYLTKQDIADIHANLSAQVERDGDEPLPEFRYSKHHEIDALIAAPQQRFFGRDAYPTLAEKAAIVFYNANRLHTFPNGNKRMSTVCLLTFLLINGATLDVSPEELTATALWVATVKALEFPAIMSELVSWIEKHLITAE